MPLSATCSAAPPCAGALRAIAACAFTLRPPFSHELRHVRRDDAGVLIDELLTRVARGHGALDVALGDALATLAEAPGALAWSFPGVSVTARSPGPGRLRLHSAMA